MSDPWTKLEAELRGLQPRRPSPGLEARLAGELADGVPHRAVTRRTRIATQPWLRWAAGFLAAALAGGALWLVLPAGKDTGREPESAAHRTRTVASAATPPPAFFQPLSASSYPYASYQAGLTHLRDGWPARRVYQRSLEVYTWWNPRTQASVQWTVPCETVRLVPLNAY